MSSRLGKKSIGLMSMAFSVTLVLLVGCSSFNNNTSKSEVSAVSSSSVASIANSSSSEVESSQSSSSIAQQQSSSVQQSAAVTVLFKSIKALATQGKIVDCEFAAKSTNIADVQEKWGKADTSSYVSTAKGTYDTYAKHNVAFGYNKGAQIFEVRSFDKQLSQITMSMVKKDYGVPGYDYKSKSEEEIGYKVTDKFKVLFVFSLPTNANSDPQLDHYSIFYPDGTINSMANDPGREW